MPVYIILLVVKTLDMRSTLLTKFEVYNTVFVTIAYTSVLTNLLHICLESDI